MKLKRIDIGKKELTPEERLNKRIEAGLGCLYLFIIFGAVWLIVTMF